MMQFIWMIIVGFVVGLIARAIHPGGDKMGWIWTILLGIGGAVVGGVLAGIVGIGGNGGLIGLVFSVIGAMILLAIYTFVRKKM